MTVRHIDSRTGSRIGTAAPQGDAAPNDRPRSLIATGLIMGAVALTASACGSSSTSTPSPSAAATPKTVNISLVGKTDASKGPAGSFTSKEHWPAIAPSEIKVPKGATVVLTIKEYDSAATALLPGSAFNAVSGGTETVNGAATTTVSNANISHTFSIPELKINAPLTKAPEGGVSTIVYTFKADKAGTYAWRCFTPCGGEPGGMGGSMVTDGWMQGHLIVT
jgi:FtsP/CotA-like multicopper oxidase with cupredoxin domain